MKKFALIGKSLKHSFSKTIHETIYQQINTLATYELLNVNSTDLLTVISKLRTKEYSGFNVTIPYKTEVLKYLDEVSDEVKLIGSCNTIRLVDNKVVGYNTDYIGFKEQLKFFNIDLANRDCYILGSGGSSKAIYYALEELNARAHIVSRNFGENFLTYDMLKDKNLDVIINTTPLGMYPDINDSPLEKSIASKAVTLIDIIFNPKMTKLMSYNKNSYNGLVMLIAQAIKACEIFFDQKIYLDYADVLETVEEIVYE